VRTENTPGRNDDVALGYCIFGSMKMEFSKPKETIGGFCVCGSTS